MIPGYPDGPSLPVRRRWQHSERGVHLLYGEEPDSALLLLRVHVPVLPGADDVDHGALRADRSASVPLQPDHPGGTAAPHPRHGQGHQGRGARQSAQRSALQVHQARGQDAR